MQYDRNDEISYDEDFTQAGETEYYNGDDFGDYGASRDDFYEKENYDREKNKNSKPFPSVLFFQLVICILCAVLLYASKMYFPDVYQNIMDKVSGLINDSLVVEGNDLNDYFVNNG
ncbi:MAG: hypothetical protein J1F17_03770 [Oscillospiraceae bacterium]|nr:hypothetical protein [Oscillospiraceae bacterium]